MAESPPLTLATDRPPGPYECSTCCEQYQNDSFDHNSADEDQRPYKTEDGDLVCRNCIKRPFVQALKFDIEWPARWGEDELDIDDFASLWPDGIIPALYISKRAQIQIRISQLDEQTLRDLTPDGLVRGKDYQRCPKCKEACELLDGCNHIVCTCGANFCLICGVEAFDGSTHWQQGGPCPRYNHPDSGNAIYDRPTNDMPMQAGPWSPQISFASWSWNVTMQYATERTQSLMRRVLDLPVSTGPSGPLELAERDRLLRSMLSFRVEHGVDRATWDGLAATRHDEALAVIKGDMGFSGHTDGPLTRRNLLARPIGGVFNLSSETARQEAYDWAQQRYSAWTPARAEHPLNFAIFDIGPGTDEDRIRAYELMYLLEVEGQNMTEGQVEFTYIESPDFDYLLARVTGVGTALDERAPVAALPVKDNPLSGLRWHFIRPQNAREEEQREEWLLEMNQLLPRDLIPRDEGVPGERHDPELDLVMLDNNQQDLVHPAIRRMREMDQIDGLVMHDRPVNHNDRPRTLAEWEQEIDSVHDRVSEMFDAQGVTSVPAHIWDAQVAALLPQPVPLRAEDEAFLSWYVSLDPDLDEASPPHRPSSPEQIPGPWTEPWAELLHTFEHYSRAPQSTPEGLPTGEDAPGAQSWSLD